MNYTTSSIAGIVGGDFVGTDSAVNRGVAIDSRGFGVGGGDIFVALRGPRDGHAYVSAAYHRGVRAFLVERADDFSDLKDAGFVVVTNTLAALQTLATFHRGGFRGDVVAITGSNGKTIVKERISQLWPASAGILGRSPGSYNSQIGVALSLLMIRGDERAVLIEAGISRPREMAVLQRMIRPTIGLLTNIGDAHSEGFSSPREHLSEKLRLFDGLSESQIVRGDLLDLPTDVAAINDTLARNLLRILNITPAPDAPTTTPLSMRLDVQPGWFNTTIINDSYSNDQTSLKAAAELTFRTATGGPTTVILSDMDSHSDYPTIAQNLATAGNLRHFVGIGHGLKTAQTDIQNALGSGPTCDFFGSTQEFLEHLDVSRFAGHTILVKGARRFGFEHISRQFEQRTHTTVLEVNLSRIIENLRGFQRNLPPGVGTMAMVKADGYGLGAVAIARAVVAAGVQALAVAYASEGVELRRAGISAPIVVLNSDPGSVPLMLEHGLEPEIYSLDALEMYAQEVCRSGSRHMPVHLKLDTGMHRLGFMTEEVPALCAALLRHREAVCVSSIFTHLSSADDPAQDAFTTAQITEFQQLSTIIIDTIGYRPTLSITNSSGTRRFPTAPQDMARIGLDLYLGAGSLSTRITQIKHLPAGASVGYNRRHITTAATTIATIPIGYADGLNRRLGCGVGSFLVGGVMCPIVGSVCMDTTMIDISGVPRNLVNTGTLVQIMGRGASSETELADLLGTIPYEVLCTISKRIKRLYSW